jgi:hypothetical protein
VKRLGPELKMPKLKGGEVAVPPFLNDLYIDLRERRLLPLVALLLVGIVAAPILLKGGSGEKEAKPIPSLGGGAGQPGSAHTLTVVKAEPGLRNYKKRLAHRDPTNPFKQRYTAPQLAGSELNEQTSTTSTESTSTSTTSESTVTRSSGSSGGSNGSSAGGGGGSTLQPGEVQLYSFSIDIRVAHTEPTADGSLKMGKPVLRESVDRGTTLPGEKAPVLTYIGTDDEFSKALMLVSPEVTGLLGDNKCLAGKATCQLLALEPEVPEVVEYGQNGARYKFELVRLVPVKGPKVKEPQSLETSKRHR